MTVDPKERALLVANAHGELERACQVLAKKIDESNGLLARDENNYRGTIVELCIAYGRALNQVNA